LGDRRAERLNSMTSLLAPLRASRAFRRLFAFSSVSALAAEAAYVALMFQLAKLTHSPLAVGALGAVELVPIVIFGLYGGVIADHWDRRRVLITTETLSALFIGLLAWNASLTHPHLALLYVLAGALAAASGVQRPSYTAMFQHSVPHAQQRQAATLEMVQGTGAALLGPVLGGVGAVLLGPWVVFAVAAACVVVTIPLLMALPPAPPTNESEGIAWDSLFAGGRYALSRRDVLGTYVIDLVAMIFAFPVSLLPFVAAEYHASYALGALYCALPAGALIVALTERWTKKVAHYGRAVVAAAVVWGLGIVGFGCSHVLVVAWIFLAVAGGADAVSGIFRTTMWNESIPPDVRGRMAGIELLSYSVGPTSGQVRAGALAAATTVRTSLVLGGAVCAAGCAVLPAALRATWRFDARTDEHVAEVARLRASDHFE